MVNGLVQTTAGFGRRKTVGRTRMWGHQGTVWSPRRNVSVDSKVEADTATDVGNACAIPAMLMPFRQLFVEERNKLEEYEIVLDLIAGVRFRAPLIRVLNQYSHNFFSQQVTNIRRLFLKEVDRSEDYELLVKLIAMENLEECEIHNFDRKLNFIAVEACVEKWKANEQFRFRFASSGAYSKQEIEPLFGEADEDGYYALIVEGRTSRYVGLQLDLPWRKERCMSCGTWRFE
ncbi:hypothetical protein QR680_007917 [Steinernema hermaphroditum]|uniref:Uncharacterized protein n=1 Tax=Steinernema hermaphroditum TaxID=289476 RepID=A0AA39IGU7_9BILA|nr:hypothetical protein QR680_007917 [Steinernema hermaphroditum]